MIKLEQGEHIVAVVRKHWFILVSQTFFLLFLLLAPFIVSILGSALDISHTVHIAGNDSYLFISLASVWFLGVAVSFYIIWTDFYLDVIVVTNQRLMDVEQRGLFSRRVSSLRFERVQDVTVDVTGLIQTFLKFGTIHVQTAAEEREFVAFGVPEPYKLKELLTDLLTQTADEEKIVHISEESLERLGATQRTGGDVPPADGAA